VEVEAVSISLSRLREDRLALISTWVFIGFLQLQGLASTMTQVDPSLGPGRRAPAVVAILATTVVFLWVQHRLVRGLDSGRAGLAVLVALAVFQLAIADAWTSIGIAMAALLLVLPVRRGALFALATFALATTIVSFETPELALRVVIPTVHWVSAIILYALTRLAVVLRELGHARELLARTEVDQERHRISRDLHDIIGRTLVAVSLRGEAALRLLDTDIDASRRQLSEAQTSLLNGQAQLRALTSGPVFIDLATELETATALCQRLGVQCEVDATTQVDQPVGGVLSSVVREAVTNMLKHSRPTESRIDLHEEGPRLVLTVTNNGWRPSDHASVGTGLRDLAARVHEIGGEFRAGARDDTWFQVMAVVPRHPSPTPSSAYTERPGPWTTTS
jgi:two-component system sensor histidine kinase DesK